MQKSALWQAIAPLPVGNLAEKVGTVRFFRKSCLNLYLLRGFLSGLWGQVTVSLVPQWCWIVEYLNCRKLPFVCVCVAMKGALLWQRLGSHQTQVCQWSLSNGSVLPLPFWMEVATTATHKDLLTVPIQQHCSTTKLQQSKHNTLSQTRSAKVLSCLRPPNFWTLVNEDSPI